MLPSGVSWGSPGSAPHLSQACWDGEEEGQQPQPALGLFQVYMFKCVWRCYRLIKYMNSATERSSSKMLPKVSLGWGGGKG